MSAEWSEQPAAPDNSHTIPGKILAAQRETMGWSVEQVAEQLKLATRQVVALEQGDYQALPGPAVVRGFVRAYAKVVRLDAAPLVAMIALDPPPPNDATTTTVRRDKPAAFSEVRFPTNGKRKTLPVGKIALGVLVLVAAGLAWQFDLIPSKMPGTAPAASSPVSTTLPSVSNVKPAAPAADNGAAAITAGTAGTELTPAEKLSVPLISVPPTTPAPGAPGTGVPLVAGTAPVSMAAPGTAPLAAGASTPAGPGVLVLKMRDNSWVEVRPAQGPPVLKRLLRRGSTETVTVAAPLTLVVGNPGEVEASWRGATLNLPPVPGSAISRVNLN